MSATTVLVADDEPAIVDALRLLLKCEGYRVESAASPRAVIDALASRSFDVLLMDMNYARDTTSGLEGLDLVAQVRERDPALPIVVMTAWSTIGIAVNAMQRGATEFVVKPWDNDRLLTILRTQAERGRTSRRAAERNTMQEQDLARAAQIHGQMFPDALPPMATLTFAGRSIPARCVGGDFYAFVPLPDQRLAIAVADVAGHGISAALMMASFQALFRSRLRWAGDDPAAVVADLNRMLLDSIPANKFVTCFYGVYDDARRTLAYVNGGHIPPVLLRAGDVRGTCAATAERLHCGGPMVGMFPDAAFQSETIHLDRGDVLIVFTDGLTEAMGPAGEPFGDERLSVAAAAALPRTPASMSGAILAAHAAFVNPGPPEDDITLVVGAVV